jgi:hypothetical protein
VEVLEASIAQQASPPSSLTRDADRPELALLDPQVARELDLAGSEAVFGPEPQERDVECLNLMVVLRTLRKDVLGEASHMRRVEFDWLRRAVLEIAGQQVSELQAPKRVYVDGSVAAVDTGSADAFLEPASVVLTENVALTSDLELDLHALTHPLSATTASSDGAAA